MIAPPTTIHNRQLWWKHCRKVRALAQRIITGEVGIIEGARQMLAYQNALQVRDDKDFQIFRDLDEKTHNHPIGKVRVLWSAEALKSKDEEIKSYEDTYRECVIESAAKIRRKFEIAMKHKYET